MSCAADPPARRPLPDPAPIAFDEDGRLLDGQHRLRAVLAFAASTNPAGPQAPDFEEESP